MSILTEIKGTRKSTQHVKKEEEKIEREIVRREQ